VVLIIVYLMGWLLLLGVMLVLHYLFAMPAWYMDHLLMVKSTVVGGLGGVLYCLRGVYLNRCVRKGWDTNWHVWYYLRPITSSISGFVCCLFLQAGLLVLEAKPSTAAVPFGYLAIAFIAGYNVDNFMKKIESIAHTTWGIDKTRTATDETSAKAKDPEHKE